LVVSHFLDNVSNCYGYNLGEVPIVAASISAFPSPTSHSLQPFAALAGALIAAPIIDLTIKAIHFCNPTLHIPFHLPYRFILWQPGRAREKV